MSKCMSCGGFVTDNYARVFGDNEDNVFDCRNCRTDRRLSSDESDEGDDDKVLLRTVRGEDEAYTRSRGGTSTADEGASTESETSAPATADGGVAVTADAADAQSAEPTDTQDTADETADSGSGRFGVRRFLSSFRT